MSYPILRTVAVWAFLLFSVALVAQPSVDVWSVTTPPSPTNCTNTIITVNGQNDAANYTLDPITFSVVGTTITVNINYNSGFIILPAFMSWSHNVNLGSLPPGNYNIVANGSLNGNFNSSATGFMTVTACCPAIASFNLNEDTLCLGDTVEFTSTSTGPVSGQSWVWGGNTISVTNSGSQELTQSGPQDLMLIVTDGNCSDTSTQVVNVLAPPAVDLGNDTSICDGATLIKGVPGGYAGYAWSDGSTGANGSISTIGDLSVTVTSAEGCVNSDTVSVLSLIPQLSVELGADTAFCPGTVWELDAGSGFDTYEWSGGETSQSILVSASGAYVVEVGAAGSCSGRDTLEVSYFSPIDYTLSEGMDSCASRELNASSAGISNVLWSTSETSATIEVTTSGSYSILITDSNQCEYEDTIATNVAALPIVDLGGDTVICNNASILLSSGTMGTNLWSDGSTMDSLQVGAGNHWLQVTDANGCVGSDSIMVTATECLGISAVNAIALRVFPNPTAGFVTIDHPIWSSAEVYDLTGRLVLSIPASNGSQIDLTSLDQGAYTLIVRGGNGVATARLQKQ